MAISADLGTVLEAYVSRLVDSGRYNSKSEVLREGVRLVQERETHLAALDEAVAAGLADINADNTMAASEVFAGLRRRFAPPAK